MDSVKSNELKWLPNGSEFSLETSAAKSTSKPRTYTSFHTSQETLHDFSKKPIAPCHPDIILSKLGPGQVMLLTCLSCLLFFIFLVNNSMARVVRSYTQ